MDLAAAVRRGEGWPRTRAIERTTFTRDGLPYDVCKPYDADDVSSLPDRPPDPACPACGATLVHVTTEISSGAFRTQAASMPQMPIHFYDCPSCKTCWKLGQRLLPDPIRQILND